MSPLQIAASAVHHELTTYSTSEFMCHILHTLAGNITNEQYRVFLAAIQFELDTIPAGSFGYRNSVITNTWATFGKYNLTPCSTKNERRNARIQWLQEIIDGKIVYDL
jgi:hypothetical protein